MVRSHLPLLPLLVASLGASTAPSPPGRCETSAWRVCDRDQRLSPAEEHEVETMLAAYERDRGVVVRFATLPPGGEAADLPGLGGPEARSTPGGDRGLTMILAGGRLSLVAGREIAPRLDSRVIYFLERKHLAPVRLPGAGSDASLVDGVRESLATLDALLDGRLPRSYLVWKLLEAPLDERAHTGVETGLIVTLRYVVGIGLMAPLIALLTLLAGELLPRVAAVRPATGPLLILGLVGLLGALGFAVSAALEATRLDPLRPFGFMATLCFLAATPIHLILLDRVIARNHRHAFLLALAYLLFPLAILLLAASGGWRSATDRLFHGQLRSPRKRETRPRREG